MRKKSLYTQLNESLALLENRKMMIPRYIKNNSAWLGKNPYSMDMIADIDKQIDELKAAIKGIEVYRSKKQFLLIDK